MLPDGGVGGDTVITVVNKNVPIGGEILVIGTETQIPQVSEVRFITYMPLGSMEEPM